MCRTGGRRCDKKWDDTHRERYNARRRIVRNTEKALAAKVAGDDATASMYSHLADSARAEDERYSTEIAAHEASSAREAPEGLAAPEPAGERCRDCGRYAGSDHACTQQATLSTIQETSATWASSWTPDEHRAMEEYGSIAHARVNAYLASGALIEGISKEDAERIAGHLDAMLGRAPRTQVAHTLYRGIQPRGPSGSHLDADATRGWVDERYSVGSRFTTPGYSSATTRHSIAREFGGGLSGRGGVLLEVETTQAGYTGDTPEQEVVLRRGTYLEVTGRERVEIDGVMYERVVLREVL